MISKRILITIVAGMVWALGVCSGLSKDCFELESHYNGDGWFTYRFRTLDDPFIAVIALSQLTPSFTNFVASVPPDHWTNFFYQGNWEGIMYDRSSPQSRLNEIDFSVRSSSTSFRRLSLGFDAIVGIQLAPVLGGEWFGGYVNLDCLVPCAPEDADGSSPDLVSQLELVPDVKVDGLLLTNGGVYGLTFSWAEPSTVELQGSHDLAHWTPVARLFGDPPQTTWTTNVPLNSFGKFFRLMLVANRHLTNNVASATLASEHSSDIKITAEEIVNGQIRVGFASIPNAAYEVTYCEISGPALAAKQIRATNTFTTVLFPIGEPRSAARFKARQLLQ
jgi:hypothetical protein